MPEASRAGTVCIRQPLRYYRGASLDYYRGSSLDDAVVGSPEEQRRQLNLRLAT